MRRTRLTLLAMAAVVVVIVLFLPALLGTAWMRPVLRGWLGSSLGREVDFDSVSVSWLHGVRVSDLRVWPTDGSPEHPLIEAEMLALDVAYAPLLSRRIEATQVLLSGAVLRWDEQALGAPSAPPASPTNGDEDGTLALPDARIPVELRDVVVQFPTARITIERGTVEVSVTATEILVEPVDAVVNGGRIVGSVRLARDGSEHRLDLTATDVELDAEVAPLLAHVSPLLAVGPDGQATGRVSATTALRARGDRMGPIKQTLTGDGVLTFRGVGVESASWIETLLGYLSVDGRSMAVDDGDVPFTVGGGRVRTERIDVSVSGVPVRIGGSAGLDGDLDYSLTAAGLVPLRIGGTVEDPRLKPPGLDDVIDIGGALDKVKKGIGDLLGGDD